MKKSGVMIVFGTLVLVFLLAVAVVGCGKGDSAEGQYHCPMHPTYISDKPGDCPICGMRLVPMEKDQQTAPAPDAKTADSAAIYACPMHPEVTSDKPGSCPKCGMDLVLNEAAAAAPVGEGKILFYRNPMNPAITSPVPAKDEMGMDFVPVRENEIKVGGAKGVEGLAPVTMTPRGLELSGVRTAAATRGRIGGTIRTVGMVVADETRVKHMHAKVSGYIEKLYGNFTGQIVKAGQPILSIFSPELLASQQEYIRALETAEKFAASSLPEVQAGGKELVTAARRRLELFDVPASFIAKIEQTKQPQKYVTLSAPVSGFVTSKMIYEGQQVEPAMELYTFTDLSRVWIEADFYEYEFRNIHVGQEAELTLTYDPNVRIPAKVAYINPTLNPDSRTLKVRFEVANKDTVLKPSMYTNVELRTTPSDGVVFPESAVMDTGTRQVVFVETGPGAFEPREVRIVNKSEGMVQVDAGVAEGEKVVTGANFLLDSESRLKAAISGMSAAPVPGSGEK